MIQLLILLSSFLTCFNICIAHDQINHVNNQSYNIQEYDKQPLPEISFFDENDKERFLEEFDGQVLLLTFWATWCTSCLGEIEDLNILQKDFKKKPFKIIPISEDFKGIEVVSDFYKSHEIKYLDKYIDNKGKLFNAFGIVGVPTSIIIDHNNHEVGRIIGAVDWDDQVLRDLLNKYIKAVPGYKEEDVEKESQTSKKNLILNIKKNPLPDPEPPSKTIEIPNNAQTKQENTSPPSK